MNKPSAAMSGIEETSVLLLASAAALVALPHLANLPFDAPGFLLVMCAWRVGAVFRWVRNPVFGLPLAKLHSEFILFDNPPLHRFGPMVWVIRLLLIAPI